MVKPILEWPCPGSWIARAQVRTAELAPMQCSGLPTAAAARYELLRHGYKPQTSHDKSEPTSWARHGEAGVLVICFSGCMRGDARIETYSIEGA